MTKTLQKDIENCTQFASDDSVRCFGSTKIEHILLLKSSELLLVTELLTLTKSELVVNFDAFKCRRGVAKDSMNFNFKLHEKFMLEEMTEL